MLLLSPLLLESLYLRTNVVIRKHIVGNRCEYKQRNMIDTQIMVEDKFGETYGCQFLGGPSKSVR
jgi:hypothetical protein